MLSGRTGLASASPVKHSRCNRWRFSDFPLWEQLPGIHLMINCIRSKISKINCVFVAYAVPSPQSSDKDCAFHASGGLQKWSWENEISHLPSDPTQSSCTVFMQELLVKTVTLECRSHGFSPALCLLSLTNICLQKSKADMFSVSFDANCKSLWRISMECWHSEKSEISAFIPRQIIDKFLLLRSFWTWILTEQC